MFDCQFSTAHCLSHSCPLSFQLLISYQKRPTRLPRLLFMAYFRKQSGSYFFSNEKHGRETYPPYPSPKSGFSLDLSVLLRRLCFFSSYFFLFLFFDLTFWFIFFFFSRVFMLLIRFLFLCPPFYFFALKGHSNFRISVCLSIPPQPRMFS